MDVGGYRVGARRGQELVSLWVRDVDFAPRPRQGPRRPSSLKIAKEREIERLRLAGLEAMGQLSE
jgi:hypothetical protein